METTEDRAWCPTCGVRAVGHGRRRVVVRDLPMADRPVVLVWAKRLWRCPEPACPARHVVRGVRRDRPAGGAHRTGPGRDRPPGRPGEHSVAQAARDFGVSWHAAMAAVRDHGRPRVDHLARLGAPSAIGLDETSFLAATAEHPTLLVTGIIDLDAGRLVDVLPARSADAVTDWLAAKPAPWLAGIRHVVIDPYQPYATAVAAGLPDARLVVDHFHVIRLANAALDEVRRRVQHDHPRATGAARLTRSTGSAGGSSPATNASTPPASPGCWPGSTPATPTARSAPPTWPRSCCARPTSPPTPSRPAGASPPSTTTAHASDVPELERLARTIARWETPILRWHRTRLTNAATEGTNLIIKNIKRLGFGFRNFDNYRLRLLLRCGAPWQHRPVASIRPRQPRFVRVEPVSRAAICAPTAAASVLRKRGSAIHGDDAITMLQLQLRVKCPRSRPVARPHHRPAGEQVLGGTPAW